MAKTRNPVPVVVGLITTMGGLLAIQRAIPPVGGWAFPGGYVDANESAETAIAREVQEEVGVQLVDWKPITTRVTPNNQLLIFMYHKGYVRWDQIDFHPNGEVLDIKAVNWRDELCFPLHTEILRSPGLYL